MYVKQHEKENQNCHGKMHIIICRVLFYQIFHTNIKNCQECEIIQKRVIIAIAKA